MLDKQDSKTNISNTISRYNRILPILVLLGIAIAIVSIWFGVTTAPLFSWGILLLIPLIAALFSVSQKLKVLKNTLQIRNDWGKSQINKERDFKAIRTLFDHSNTNYQSENYIDEQTWKDLNLDQLYAKIDRAYTDPGEAVLYEMLREPPFNQDELTERNWVIRFFQKNQPAREQIQFILIRLGHQFVRNDLFNLLWRDSFPKIRLRPLFITLSLLALASFVIPFALWSPVYIPIPIVMFIINLIVHYSIKRRKDLETISFPYLIGLIKAAKDIAAVKNGEIKPYTQKISESYQASHSILSNARFLLPASSSVDSVSGVFYEYLNIFFLLEVNAFYATTDDITKHISELRQLYLILGKLDALQSVASYRASLSSYAEPIFDKTGLHLEVKDARQPLLEKPVPASITIGKNVVIITGSNMGGKSTFLRNIGNNVLLAQTIATTLTAYYSGSFFKIITSISRTDDLIAGKSFYYVEAERILKTIQSFNKEIPTLCLIDELLSGTNSVERLQASEAIIRYLTEQNSLAIIATHDLELADKLKDICDFYHFTDNVDETGLKFDYLLKPGIAKTRNAIAMLKYLGYPKEITGNNR